MSGPWAVSQRRIAFEQRPERARPFAPEATNEDCPDAARSQWPGRRFRSKLTMLRQSVRGSTPGARRWRPVGVAIILFLGSLALYCYGLGADSVRSCDEALYQETAREMLESGDWFTPRFNYEPRYQKPPLQYWLIALAFRAFGVNAAVGRLPSALICALGVVIAYLFGRRLFDERAAVWGAALLAVGAAYHHQAQGSKPDAGLTVCIWLATLAAVVTIREPSVPAADEGSARRRLFRRVGLWVALGLGVLLKGPVAILLPALMILPFIALTRNWCAMRALGWEWGVPLLLIIAAPWYVGMWLLHGQDFIEVNIMRENVQRFLSVQSRLRWTYYLEVYPAVAFPFAFFLFPAACESIASRRDLDGRRRQGLLLCWTAVLAVLAFFTIARGKLAGYIIPTYLPAALLAGFVVSRCDVGEAVGRATCAALVVAAAASLVVAVALTCFVTALGASPASSLGLLFACTIAGALVPSLATRGLRDASTGPKASGRSGVPALLGAVVGAAAGCYLILNAYVWPLQESLSPLRPVARVVSDIAGPETPVIVADYERGWRPLVFYLRRPVVHVSRSREFLDALPEEPAVCVLPTDVRDALPKAVRKHMRTVSEFAFPSRAKFLRQVEGLPLLLNPRYRKGLAVVRWTPRPPSDTPRNSEENRDATPRM